MDRIPKELKKYIKKTRSSKKENKIPYPSQKQSNKQQQIVVINGSQTRRRGPNKPKQPGGGGGGSQQQGGGGGPGDYPRVVYIPQTFPNMTLPGQAPSIVQEIPQSGMPFSPAARMYHNPGRMAPFRNILNPPPQMNPPPFSDLESPPINQAQNIFTPPPPPPNPGQPDIVQEPVYVDSLSSPPIAVPIFPSSSPYQGFTQNEAVNDLSRQVDMEVNAFEDYGGEDAQSPTIPLRLQRENDKINEYKRQREGDLPFPSSIPIMSGGGGGPSNKGRPFTALTDVEKEAVIMYARYKDDKRGKSDFTETERALYKRGNRLLSQNKSNNPELVAFYSDIVDKFGLKK